MRYLIVILLFLSMLFGCTETYLVKYQIEFKDTLYVKYEKADIEKIQKSDLHVAPIKPIWETRSWFLDTIIVIQGTESYEYANEYEKIFDEVLNKIWNRDSTDCHFKFFEE